VGQEKVTEMIEKILGGITFNEIVSSTVVAQKELNKLIELRKDDRKKIINVFLNLESFNKVLDSLDERRRGLEGTREREGRIQAEKDKLNSLRAELDEFQRRKEKRDGLLKENEELRARVEKLGKDYAEKESLYRLLTEYEEAVQSREKLEIEIREKESSLGTYTSRKTDAETNLGHVKTRLQEYSDLEQSEGKLAEIRKAVETVKVMGVRVAEARSAYQKTEQEVKELEGTLPPGVDRFDLERRLRQGGKPLWPYAAGSVLGLLGGVTSFMLGSLVIAIPLFLAGVILLVVIGIRVSVVSRLPHLQEIYNRLDNLDRATETRDAAQQNLVSLSKELEEKEEYLSRLCMGIPRYRASFAENRGGGILQAAEKVLQLADSDRQALNSLKTRLDTIQEELSKLPPYEALRSMENEVKTLKNKLDGILLPALPSGITFTKDMLQTTNKEKEELAGEIRHCETMIDQNARHAREHDEWLEEHKDVEQRFNHQLEIVARMERELRVVKKAIEGIQVTAEALRARVKPSVQAYMSSILPRLTSGRYKAAIIDEDYSVQVWDPDAGQYRVKEVFSGGTEDQFLLGMRLAFALALLPEVKGQKPEFLFLDEPLGSSDEVRRSGIIDYLNTDLSKKFRQIFIISHVGGLEEHVKNIINLNEGRVE